MGNTLRLFGSRAVIAGLVLIAGGLILGRVADRNEGYPGLYNAGRVVVRPTPGWSDTAYDAALVAAWMLILIGLVWVIVALIRFWVTQRAQTRGRPLS